MRGTLSGTTVYLTGGSGFIGSHLRERLAAVDCSVTVLASPDASVSPGPDETVVRGDVTDPESIDITGHDVVVHLAGRTSVDQSLADPTSVWAVNATGTQTVLEAARGADVERFLYASTASVYGIPQRLPIAEDHRLEPIDPYGASKLAGDRLAATYAHAYDFPVVIPRLFNTFGPRQPRYNVVGAIVSQALAGDTVELGSLSTARDFTYVADVVDALVCLLTDGAVGQTYNVGSGEALTIGSLAERIVALFDRDIEVVASAERQRRTDIERHVADASKLRGLGWEPSVGLDAGLEATVEWFRDQQ